jgi:diguanylate cyclase (GGDEF)-like protein
MMPSQPVLATLPNINLTPQEKAYIEQVGSIKMCVDPDWVPFEHINKQGQHEGIAADLVQLATQRVGLKIELYPTKNWDESLAAAKRGRCQIMSFLNKTPAREVWLIFTEPLFYDQNIIITREEHPYIGDPVGLDGHIVVLPRGTMVEERIRRDYPNLKVITTGSEAEAIAYVSERKADMTVRSLIVAAYAIKKEGFFNLKISGQIPAYTNALRIGVLKDQLILRDILDKGISTITAQEREAIANKHVPITIQRGMDYTLIWQIITAAVIIMLLVLAWSFKLKTLNNKLAQLAVRDPLTDLFNRQKINQVLASELKRSLRYGPPFSVILLDINFFRPTNDRFARQVMDQILRAVARVLQVNTREVDALGRWEDETFIIVCINTDQNGAAIIKDNLLELIKGIDVLVMHHLTARVGVATFQTGDVLQDILNRADTSLRA